MQISKNKSVSTPPPHSYKGFTLAEVLITLVIIGVIAAITVPTLMNKTNNQEYVAKLKKAYSTLAQATNMIIAEEGTVKRWGLTNDDDGKDKVYNLYKKHLLNAKECNADAGCYPQEYIYELNGDRWYRNNNTWGKYRNLILSDGLQIMFDDWIDPECSSAFGTPNYTKDVCMGIYLDINGARKPNKFGRDVFRFVLKEKGLYPAGCDTEEDICVTQQDGRACACKVLREGAMNY